MFETLCILHLPPLLVAPLSTTTQPIPIDATIARRAQIYPCDKVTYPGYSCSNGAPGASPQVYAVVPLPHSIAVLSPARENRSRRYCRRPFLSRIPRLTHPRRRAQPSDAPHRPPRCSTRVTHDPQGTMFARRSSYD
ncbi:hypothetical protein C8Q79DRAFT_158355 [Trametes meyenii]|nr:hypothetical protein C8Q79DRAFT_158355 [Trametes meyenii]